MTNSVASEEMERVLDERSLSEGVKQADAVVNPLAVIAAIAIIAAVLVWWIKP